MKNHDLLRAAYAAFNGRDIEGGIGGDASRGRMGERYGRRDTARAPGGARILDPAVEYPRSRVEPLSFEEDGTGRVMVRAHQVVRDLRGTVIADRTVCHTYAFEDDLIRSMEIGDQYSGGECRASALTGAQS
jgi:hypothetical protein